MAKPAKSVTRVWTVIKKHPKATVVIIFAVILWASIAVKVASAEHRAKALQKQLTEAIEDLEKAQNILATTQEERDYQEEQVKLYKESTNALIDQVSDLNAVNEDLNNQLEDLLRVKEALPTLTRAYVQEQITAISELAVKKYEYRNAVKKEGEKVWLWGWTMPFSDTSLLATYDGVIKAGIDVKDIKISVNNNTRVITITIPPSKILDHNIPQETINVLEVRNNLFNKITFNDYNKFIAAEKMEMEKVAIDHNLLTDADKEARQIIELFLKSLPGIDAYTLTFN